MTNLNKLNPEIVFEYFEKISKIPRGSGNMKGISKFCVEFAESLSLRYIKDEYDNVIIFKNGSEGYENVSPVILQAHLDMVCQKEDGVNIDFESEGIDVYTDGDLLKARGTTLGADDGIGVAIILAILSDDSIAHPPIEAVFTTDEEIGMIGASKMCLDEINGRHMINLDSGCRKIVTVSCAGGSDFEISIPVKYKLASGTAISICISGLKGGHSGVEIDKGRVNADILMGRILHDIKKICNFSIIGINGGNKGNAIPVTCKAEILIKNKDKVLSVLKEYAENICKEFSDRENEISIEVNCIKDGEFNTISASDTDKIVNTLVCIPNGVQEMSVTIENLVETSLNLGVLTTYENTVKMLITLRSNKKTSLKFLEEKLETLAETLGCITEIGGHYPPWEFNNCSKVLALYRNAYKEKFGTEPISESIHAGLECGVFASKIKGFDCISIGPDMFDIHTPAERLSISSTIEVYELIVKVLSDFK